jgi:hypothetical protein
MSDDFSPRDLSTYKQWLAKIAIVYCALAAAIIIGISWDLFDRGGLSVETAQSFDIPTSNILVGSHN